MIDTIIFDMGQVLIRWTGTLMLEKYELSETDHSLLLRELFGDVEWVMLDHGTISFEEAVKAVCRRVPEHLHGIVREVVGGGGDDGGGGVHYFTCSGKLKLDTKMWDVVH